MARPILDILAEMPPDPPIDWDAQDMRGLSLWEPWATAVAQRFKRYETRPWGTKYRGWILICSTSKFTQAMREHADLLWRSAVGRRGGLGYEIPHPKWSVGCALAVVKLLDVLPTEQVALDEGVSRRELALGDYRSGRFAWKFGEMHVLRKPYPIKGRQRLWRVSPEDRAAIGALLRPLAT